MGNEVRCYIDQICSQIKWKNYRSSIKAELQNHITDNINDFMAQGMTREMAIAAALENMGNPDMLGRQLNKAYQPVCNKLLLFTVAFAIMIFLVFESAAILQITGDYLYIIRSGCNILLGSLGAFFIFINDWSCVNNLNRFVSRLFIIIIALCLLLHLSGAVQTGNIINGMLLLLPTLCCYYVGRVRRRKSIGLLFIVLVFSIPIFISCYMQSFAGMIIISFSAWITCLFTIKSNWLELKRKKLFYVIAAFPCLLLLIYSLIMKSDNILLNRKGFFVWEIIRDAKMYGSSGSNLIDYRIVDYPVTTLIAEYGYIVLAAYIIFLIIILMEIIKIYKKQYNFLARLFIISVLVSIIMEFVFSIPLNLGIPLAKGISVPYLNFNFGIVTKIIQLGLVVMLDCFGNYIFSDHSRNKLFEIDGGRIIIYYK